MLSYNELMLFQLVGDFRGCGYLVFYFDLVTRDGVRRRGADISIHLPKEEWIGALSLSEDNQRLMFICHNPIYIEDPFYKHCIEDALVIPQIRKVRIEYP